MRFDEVFGPGRSTGARPEPLPLNWARITYKILRFRLLIVKQALDEIDRSDPMFIDKLIDKFGFAPADNEPLSRLLGGEFLMPLLIANNKRLDGDEHSEPFLVPGLRIFTTNEPDDPVTWGWEIDGSTVVSWLRTNGIEVVEAS